MADPQIKIKRSAVAGKIPTSDQLLLGEIALNTYDGRLFASRDVGIGTTVFAINPWIVGVGTNTYNTYFTEGSVGIGTNNPAAGIKLDVVGGEIKAGRVDTGSEGGQVSFGRSTDNATAWYLDVYGSTSTPDFRVIDVSNAAVRAVFSGSGNFGIKNATPTSALDVSGDAKVLGVVTATSFVGDGSGLTNVGGGNTSNIRSTTLTVSGIATISGLKYPGSDGTNGQVLTTDGAGNLTFQDVNSSSSTTTTSTAQTSINTFSAGSYVSAIYNIQITSGSDVHFTTLNLVHDGTTVSLIEYGTIRTSGNLATFDSDISAGNVRILATPSSSSSTIFKFNRVLISSSGSNTTTATTSTVASTQIDSFAAATYPSAKLEIEVTRGTSVQMSTLNLINNGIDVHLVEYAIIRTDNSLASFDAVISGSNVVINATATSATSTTYKIKKTYIT